MYWKRDLKVIRVNFCRTGAIVSDWEVAPNIEFLKAAALKSWEQEMVYDFSNMLLFDALRVEIAEGNLSLDNIQFSYEDEPIRVNHYGACNEDYPKMGEINLNYVTRTLIAATNKRKQEREDEMMERHGVKTLQELVEKRNIEKTLRLAERYGTSGEDLGRIMRQISDEKKEDSNLAKAIEEGQAPGPGRDSTTSGNQ